MEVCNRTNNTSFSGTHLLETKVLKKAVQGYLPKKANIVEVNFSNPEDLKALEELPKSWQGAEFISIITSPSSAPNRKVYAITTQTDNFDKLKPSEILGIADFYLAEKNATLSFLQADSNIIKQQERDIKSIGKQLMYGLCEHFKQLGIETMDLFAESGRKKPFYKKIFPTIMDKPSTCDSYTNLVLDLKTV
ncbi:MAG: hypothetical protein NC200_05005 [Candidatus Gastranaerophilales bacterium]|nr:hypothetical protein [Candidatus Gastranaerophilales bacterium]